MSGGSGSGSRAVERPEAGLEAIVLAGGRSTRLGTDKAAVELGRARLVDRVIDAARASGAALVTVVGPPSAGTRADRVMREEPAFAGPLAGLAAALPGIVAEEVLLLSCDLVSPDAVCAALAESLPPLSDGLVLVDAEGREQWLAGRYRSSALREAVLALGPPEHKALRLAFEQLGLIRVAAGGIAADIDTPDDLAEARENIEGHENAGKQENTGE